MNIQNRIYLNRIKKSLGEQKVLPSSSPRTTPPATISGSDAVDNNIDPDLQDDYNRLTDRLKELMDMLKNCHSFDCQRYLDMIDYFYEQLCGMGFSQFCGGYTPGGTNPIDIEN